MTNILRERVSQPRLRLDATALTIIIVVGMGMIATLPAQAQTLTVLHNFGGAPSDGGNPYAGVVLDNEGNIYGDTQMGGASNYGAVFKLDTNGTETLLHSFTGSDGKYPYPTLLRDVQGNLYGTTYSGGPVNPYSGTVFKVDTSGTLTVLHNFGGAPDGTQPFAGVIEDRAGNLYGTTSAGGTIGYGAVFKLSKDDKLTVLHSFTGPDGTYPTATLVLDDKGNLYGTAQGGGSSYYGTVFKVSKKGKFTVLHNFSGWKTDGCYPIGGLVIDGGANLYGMTSQCGSSGYGGGDGVVFRVDARGRETVLYSFTGGADGAIPYARLLQDGAGNLFGTTAFGGAYRCGNVFELSKDGKLTVLHSFSGSDGFDPFSDVARDAAGNLYGTTFYGQYPYWGTVWRLTP
jgi:uncharacterized repeat protein (TIGR03803 family)